MHSRGARTKQAGSGEMQETTREPIREDQGRMRRSYRLLLAVSIFLAAIGAPILMQGAVVFAHSVSEAPGEALWGFAIFALSATPLALAGYTWKRTHGFQDDVLERD